MLWKGVDVLVMSIGIVVALGIGVAALVAVLMGIQGVNSIQQQPLGVTLGTIALQGIVMLLAVGMLGLARRRYSWADIGLVKTSRGWVLAAVGLFIVLRIVVTVMAFALAQIGITSMQPQAFAPEGFSVGAAAGMIIFAGILVPIAEEVFFRGVLYRWLRDKWGVGIGIIVSGIVFGLVHIEPATAIPAMVLGWVLAWAFERSKSLWPSILIHILNNTFALGLLYALLALNVPIPSVNS
jgi:membrane protease YdiL (CAAX protease family)